MQVNQNIYPVLQWYWQSFRPLLSSHTPGPVPVPHQEGLTNRTDHLLQYQCPHARMHALGHLMLEYPWDFPAPSPVYPSLSFSLSNHSPPIIPSIFPGPPPSVAECFHPPPPTPSSHPCHPPSQTLVPPPWSLARVHWFLPNKQREQREERRREASHTCASIHPMLVRTPVCDSPVTSSSSPSIARNKWFRTKKESLAGPELEKRRTPVEIRERARGRERERDRRRRQSDR